MRRTPTPGAGFALQGANPSPHPEEICRTPCGAFAAVRRIWPEAGAARSAAIGTRHRFTPDARQGLGIRAQARVTPGPLGPVWRAGSCGILFCYRRAVFWSAPPSLCRARDEAAPQGARPRRTRFPLIPEKELRMPHAHKKSFSLPASKPRPTPTPVEPEKAVLIVRLELELKSRTHRLARELDRSDSSLVREALRAYLAAHEQNAEAQP